MLSKFSMKPEHFAVKKQCELAFGSKEIRDFSEKYTMKEVRESVFDLLNQSSHFKSRNSIDLEFISVFLSRCAMLQSQSKRRVRGLSMD